MATIFDEIPESLVVFSTPGSYTIPAGYYGIARVQANSGGTITINGTTVLSSINDSWDAIKINNSPKTGTNSGGDSAMAVGNPGTALTGGSATFANSTATDQSSAEQTFKLPAGTVLANTGNSRGCIELYLM